MKRFVLLCTVAILILCLFSCDGGDGEKDPNSVYATVNGENITQEEIDYFSQRLRSKLIYEFSKKYEIEDYALFWENEYDGVNPKEELEKRALEEAARYKIELLLMKEEKIYDDISYNGLREKALRYNEANAGRPTTVGITSINMDQFYMYYIANGQMELKNIYAEEKMKPTEEEIETYMATAQEGLTQEGAISEIVEQKYGEYVDEIVSKAEVKKL